MAEALGREYVRLSLGGIHDEAEIRGHRRTYIGALPGSILKSMQKAGTSNPVMVLDEVDKLQSGGYNGDPASAMLEVLDPEQNNTFTDHYLDLPYDLSDVFFIATANTADTIPQPLLDRMEVISISGYTDEEKFHIGNEHLIPQVLEEIGLVYTGCALQRSDGAWRASSGTTPGKLVCAVLRNSCPRQRVWWPSGSSWKNCRCPYRDQKTRSGRLFGQPPVRHDQAQKENPAGVVTGLAWTPVGGEILFIEAVDMPGSGALKLTGKLGDVMQESAMISLSLLRSRLPLNTSYFKEHDLHIHVPGWSGAKGRTFCRCHPVYGAGIAADRYQGRSAAGHDR
ncbi:MAG: S16 family serine protease [Merdibacter sp.]